MYMYMRSKMLNIRLYQAQFNVKLFVFIFASTRIFDWFLLKPDNLRSDPIAFNVRHFEKDDDVEQTERRQVESCINLYEFEIQRELERFEANRNICITHHQYLKDVDSFVIEVGGHTGEDATMMVNMYNPRYVILEPVDMYADILKEKFKSNSRVTVLNVGLGKTNEYVNIKSNNTGTKSNHAENSTIVVKDATEFFKSIRVGKFDMDLLMMDCHGCELDVLENIIESNLVINFKNIQFNSHGSSLYMHNASVNQKERYCNLQEKLSRTHRSTFQFKYIYENWRRNDIS
ncbi:uncharacterized protein LOC123549285 isoform X2 [Mercenaria mercenaria]|uniref:uncharacterized protein LOC123549285 isoform X2 n=1 Tax=Mercenaria mercenaria TaxID=6596 RepID=UPI00234F3015|nr:uncharacterized protein LOC123549285 isoform X2 [Mercenaria mercenaria]